MIIEYTIAMTIIFGLLFFVAILICMLRINKKATDGMNATFNMCVIENQYIQWRCKNKDKDTKDPILQDFLRKRIIVLAIFMKTHSIKECDDNFECSLRNLLNKLVGRDAFVITYKKLLKGLAY